ncbi:hypothetical protein [Arthrobacter sp. HLT1-20]
MGNETLILLLGSVAATAVILLAGCVLLTKMASVRTWRMYLAVVPVATALMLWASLKLWSLWELSREPWNDGGVRADEIEFAASFQANAPLLCTGVLFVGGLLLGLLGWAAAKDRAAQLQPATPSN